MYSLEDLKFAQKYPFSNKAREIIKELKIDLNNVPESAVKRAALMISNASKNQLNFQEPSESLEVVKNEVLAFPVAKIILAFIGNLTLNEKFSKMIGRTAFKYIEREKEKTQTILDLASELNVSFSLSSKQNFFAEIPLTFFLKTNFKEPFMKLVNQKLEKGIVFLNENDFARFLSEFIYETTFDSIPSSTENLPKVFESIAGQISSQLTVRERKDLNDSFSGANDPDAYPPCMQQIYDDLISGKNAVHQARFNIATFLIGIGLDKEKVIELFSKTPNFNEKITRYQVERIAGKGGTKYSAPSCEKIRSQRLCPNSKFCEGFSHPISFYKARLKNQAKNSSKKAGKDSAKESVQESA